MISRYLHDVGVGGAVGDIEADIYEAPTGVIHHLNDGHTGMRDALK